MIANDIKTTLTGRMAGFQSFSIGIDESTDLSDTAQLATFIKGTSTEEDIFNEVQKIVVEPKQRGRGWSPRAFKSPIEGT
ncbi:hypothetical protein EVAR_36515_1 [Eumeta japonica]|uniref:General transcription factor II-I repeat domain-containing protein 2A n=1 Tax=Eumeta variegata TaxID=151549 RepID=A0A4C1X9L5_EUMVA|nr:hypothetical protein EVAR_36515_1 [Eumeta japonica]